MESNENSFEASSKVSMGQDQSKLYSIDFESSENLNFYQNKDFSIRKNSLSLEKDLNLLSQKVTDLKHKNKKLKSNLNLALREKEINIENHAKEISKILKENKRLREQLEAESRKHKKESQGLREEFDKIKKEYKKFCISSETKIKNLQSELQQQREINLNQAQRNERENNVKSI
jgi:chromosome segregation ATPase